MSMYTSSTLPSWAAMNVINIMTIPKPTAVTHTVVHNTNDIITIRQGASWQKYLGESALLQNRNVGLQRVYPESDMGPFC